jgi:hypothetical protein
MEYFLDRIRVLIDHAFEAIENKKEGMVIKSLLLDIKYLIQLKKIEILEGNDDTE